MRVMAHLPLPPAAPGIEGLYLFRPDLAAPLRVLLELVFRGPGPLAVGERELIAGYVSARNGCTYFATAHAAAAMHLLNGDVELVTSALHGDGAGDRTERLTPRLHALLRIAGKVREDGRTVTPEDVARAKSAGASDLELHDTVLIASVCCMFDRYVDGLATDTPADANAYDVIGRKIVNDGYLE